MSPRKPSSQELTKEIILNEARTQFIEKDYQQVSMRSIATQLGCSHGAIYYHYKNKAELFYAIIEDSFSTLNMLMEEIVKGTGYNRQKLRTLFLGLIEFGLNNQSQYELMFMKRNTEVDALSHEAASRSYEKFAVNVQALSLKKLRISDVYSAFISLHGFVSYYCGYAGSFAEVEEVAKLHVDFIIKGLDSQML
jgi:AcrR family transcriptional regulator